jgi:GntR family transcriptional repressor for pyruvate dehydrogenase complex
MTLQFEKLHVLSAYQVVSRELRRLIVSGELKAGDRLPTEAELAEQFGVNRSTVREGIRQLENEGLVSREGRKRLIISVPGSGRISSQASRALVMRQVTFRELWEATLVMEPACASLSALNRNDDQIAALETNLERTRHSLSNVRHTIELDTEFHTLVSEGARNKARFRDSQSSVAAGEWPHSRCARTRFQRHQVRGFIGGRTVDAQAHR